MPHSSYPRIWHLIYVDEHTCQDEDAGGISAILPPPRDYLQYEILLLNPDALGNPLEHFGDEETGIKVFSSLLENSFFPLHLMSHLNCKFEKGSDSVCVFHY